MQAQCVHRGESKKEKNGYFSGYAFIECRHLCVRTAFVKLARECGCLSGAVYGIVCQAPSRVYLEIFTPSQTISTGGNKIKRKMQLNYRKSFSILFIFLDAIQTTAAVAFFLVDCGSALLVDREWVVQCSMACGLRTLITAHRMPTVLYIRMHVREM